MASPDAQYGTVDYLGQFSAVDRGTPVSQTPLGLLGRKPGGIPVEFLRLVKPQNFAEMRILR